MDVFKGQIPLYLQVKKILHDRISHGVYAVGTNIPTENKLEEEFGVSKITVRNAVKELVQEGFLEKQSGKGTKVMHHTSVAKLTKGKRFTELLVDEGHQLQKVLLDVKTINLSVDDDIQQYFGRHCLKVERVYYLDKHPYIYFAHYLAPTMEAVNDKAFEQHSMYDLISEAGLSMETFRDKFSVAKAPAYVMESLGKPSEESVFKRIRHSYDATGGLIEYSEGFYNTDLQAYIVDYEI